MRAAATAWWCGALWAAGCFTGGFLAGRPCATDRDCGPILRCEDRVCGGLQTGSSSTGDPGVPTGTATSEVTGPTTGVATGGDDLGPRTEASLATDVTSTGETDAGETACVDAHCRQLDLLVIIDDSASMAQWQPALGDALQSLATGPFGALVRGSCDAHIGVLTTGALYAANPVPCQSRGALVRAAAQPCAGAAPYATEADDLSSALDCRIAVGTAGSHDERPVQALLHAMTPAYNDPGACNDGFLRPDSLLVVLLITDEDDDADPEDEMAGAETPGTPEDWFASVVAFKGTADRVVMLALTGESGPVMQCPWSAGPAGQDGSGAEAPTRLRDFIELFPRRAVATLCQRDYAGFITGAATTQLQAGCEAHAAGRP